MYSATLAKTTSTKPFISCDLVYRSYPSHCVNSQGLFALVIQGNADLGPRLSEVEVQNALDFCGGLFTPVNPDAANALRKHLEGLDGNSFPPPSREKTSIKDIGMEGKQDCAEALSRPGRKRSGTIDVVRRWLGKVNEIPEEVEPGPVTRCPPTTPSTPVAPGRPTLLSRRRGTISSTNPPPQVPGQYKLHTNAAALMDLNAPLLPPIEIQSIAKHPSLLPPFETGSTEEAEAEMQRILEKINARRVIHREHNGLHSLEEEALGSGYRMRLQHGRLGLVHVEALD